MSKSHLYSSFARSRLLKAAERLNGSTVLRKLEALDDTQFLDRERLQELQWEKLRNLIAHAYAFVPYYRRLFDSLKIKPDDIRTLADYSEIPLLTKALVRENLNDLRAVNSDIPMRVVKAQTGGTTGEPLVLHRDAECNSLTRAALLRSYTWTGYRVGDPMLFLTGGQLLGAAQSWSQRLGFVLMNYHFMPGFKLRSETLDNYVDLVRAKKIRYIRGYSTLIHQFAELCEDRGITDLKLQAAYPTAEMLNDSQVERIERVFQCTVFNHYGCAEVNALANECSEEKRFHLIEEHVLMEEISEPALGEQALVMTDLDNYAQPFIRYANGDRGEIGDGECGCGRPYRYLEKFLGRSSDAIYLPSGETYPGVFFHHLFGHFPGVTHFQVVQERRGELEVRVVKNAGFGDGDEARLITVIREHTGIQSTVNYVDEIARNPGGKISSVICTVGRD